MPAATLRHRAPTRLPPAVLAEVQAYIAAHLGERLTLADLAPLTRRCRWGFVHAFRATTGLSPMAYVQRERLQRAAWLLTHTALSVGQIAQEVGWRYPNRLSLHFKRWAGMTPRQYRRAAFQARSLKD